MTRTLVVLVPAILATGPQPEKPMPEPEWKAFQLADLDAEHAAKGRGYLKFLDVPTMSAGLYVLPAGTADRQSPHDEDEIYYVLEGTGKFTAAGETTDVKPGTILFVRHEIEHRFHDFAEDLRILVVFSGAKPGD